MSMPPEDKYGPLQPSAKRLLEKAQDLRQNQPLDTLHFLLAAFEPGVVESSVSEILKKHLERRQTSLIRFAEGELQENPAPAAAQETTDRLTRCIAAWRHAAIEQNKPLTDGLLLWAIFQDERITELLTHGFNVDLKALTNALYDLDRGDPDIPPPLEQVQTGSSYMNRDIFLRDTENILNALGESAAATDHPPVILYGHVGSPIDKVVEVLAYRLASREPFIDIRAPLRAYRMVLNLNMVHIKGDPKAPEVVEHAREVCQKLGAILLFDHIEALQGKGKAIENLRHQFVNQRGCLIFGRYVYSGERPKDVSLGIPTAKLIHTESYQSSKPEDTRAFLTDCCLPRWNAEGYAFTNDAFDSLICLEPGAWVDNKRMALPYLAVHLGDHTIQAASQKKEHIIQTAREALAELDELHRREWTEYRHENRDEFQACLDQARHDLEKLITNPEPEKKNGLLVLTRAHVIAEFLCHNNSEFHYPGISLTTQ